MNKPAMSLWGIGPLYTIISILLYATAILIHIYSKPLFSITWIPAPVFTILGLLLVTGGLLIWIPAGFQVDDLIRANIMASQGIYGVVRNPIYSGIFFVMTGFGMFFRSYLLLLPSLLSYILLRLLITREEQILSEHFGSDFASYKETVNAILPDPSGIIRAFFYPCQNHQIAPGLFVIKDRDVNFFLFQKDETAILIDCGYDENAVRNGLESFGFRPEDIDAVFLTHTDIDHRGGLEAFPETPLYLGRDEEPLINGKKGRILGVYHNKVIRRSYTLLADGDCVNIGQVTIRAFSAPGHTPGHTAFLLNGKYLFTGDAFIYQNGSIKTFYRPFNMDHRQTRQSAAKLMSITGIELYCTSHTGLVRPSDLLQLPEGPPAG